MVLLHGWIIVCQFAMANCGMIGSHGARRSSRDHNHALVRVGLRHMYKLRADFTATHALKHVRGLDWLLSATYYTRHFTIRGVAHVDNPTTSRVYSRYILSSSICGVCFDKDRTCSIRLALSVIYYDNEICQPV